MTPHNKKPYYGKQTKKRIIQEYYQTSASMKELSELHGIMGSNTLSDWLKKHGNLRSKECHNFTMKKSHASEKDKTQRKKRYKSNEQLYLSELEMDLATAQKRTKFYSLALNVINELASELIGVDLLKKTGQELSNKTLNSKL